MKVTLSAIGLVTQLLNKKIFSAEGVWLVNQVWCDRGELINQIWDSHGYSLKERRKFAFNNAVIILIFIFKNAKKIETS